MCKNQRQTGSMAKKSAPKKNRQIFAKQSTFKSAKNSHLFSKVPKIVPTKEQKTVHLKGPKMHFKKHFLDFTYFPPIYKTILS